MQAVRPAGAFRVGEADWASLGVTVGAGAPRHQVSQSPFAHTGAFPERRDGNGTRLAEEKRGASRSMCMPTLTNWIKPPVDRKGNASVRLTYEEAQWVDWDVWGEERGRG
ncbi:hypothetical protein PBY51_000404 [Eleginops maclovinus]|uniref:Uncharacterized protein n=1 Tax=Eleginops maclovinus TaxID=56733 RepID=A0AAN8AP46_ELEMC|nr:hypothetical protein PBY51_000404 [Eleginops maclovinus]